MQRGACERGELSRRKLPGAGGWGWGWRCLLSSLTPSASAPCPRAEGHCGWFDVVLSRYLVCRRENRLLSTVRRRAEPGQVSGMTFTLFAYVTR